MAYTTGTLAGKYLMFDGSPASGTIEIIPNSPTLVDDEGDVILSGRVKVTLDETGAFSLDLPATDDATVEPAEGRQYTVAARLRHQHLAAVTLELPAGQTVDMADVSSAAATATAVSVWLTQEEYTSALTLLEGRVDAAEAALPGKAAVADVDALETLTTSGRLSDASLSATYARTIPHVAGIPWFVYGHSYLASDSRNTPGSRYITRLEKAHQPASVANRAFGGRLAQQVLRDIAGNQSQAWVAGTKGLVIADFTANDMIWRGAHPLAIPGYEHTIRAMLSVFEAGQRIEDNNAAFTYTGTWSPLTGNNLLSGSNAMSSAGTAANEAASIQFTGTGATLLILGWSSTASRDQGELLIDGNVVRTVDTGGLFLADGANTYMPIALRVTGLANVTHTLTWRRKNSSVGNIWVEALLTHSPAPPTVILVKQAYMTTAAYNVNGIATPATDATVDAYNAVLDTVAAEFPNAYIADPTPGFDKTTMWGADGYHLNDLGMAHYAAAIEATMETVGWRHGQNKLTD